MVLLFGGFATVVQLLEKLLDITVCLVIMCAVPVLATRVPQKARNPLGQLRDTDTLDSYFFY